MSVEYRITSKLRKKLHNPFGILIKGSISDNKEKLNEIVEENISPIIISVGDIVSRRLYDLQYYPKIIIIDNKCMRKKLIPRKFPIKKVFYVRNPPGTITDEAINSIKEACGRDGRSQIIVEGEEDLLTLIAVLFAPEKALVIYGQPKEGFVAIKVTENKKIEIKRILKDMKPARKTK
ncbi:MAG: hypothetical protein AC479_00800 [miscellaneous Crenarchaeota group-6 archaeon AD8-1]|nr:MAG: hypothetical protein AC479_00800 [miscellaneous Crenarchaeota group-6 archaeon AD8-1]